MKCPPMRLALLAIGLVTVNALALSSYGAPTVYFDRDNDMPTDMSNSLAEFNRFTAALKSYGVETVEDIDTSTPPVFGFDPTLTFGSTGITATTQMTTSAFAAPFPGFYSIGSKMLVENDALALFDPMAPQLPEAPTIFSFNQHITAFGLFVIQGGDQGSPPSPTNNDNPTTFRLTDTVTSTSTDVTIQVGPGWGDFNVFFFGVTDTVPFNQVSILETGDLLDGMLYDNIVAGFAIPEPNSFALMLLSGACALCRRNRHRYS